MKLANLPILRVLVLPEPKHGSFTLWAPWVFCFGIAFWFAPDIEPQKWFVPALFAISILGFVWLRLFHQGKAKTVFLSALACAFLAGSLMAEIRSYSKKAPVMPSSKKSWVITGVLEQIDREKGHRARYLVRVENIEGLEPQIQPKYLRIGGLTSPAETGSRVRFRASVEPPRQSNVPGGFSFARHSWFRQIGGTGFTWGHLKVLEQSTHSSLGMKINRFRYDLSKTVRQRIGGQSGAIAAALITGDRSAIEPEISQNFRDAGLGHLLAISGLHMSLVGGFVFVVMSMLLAAIPVIGAQMDARKPAAVVGLVVSFSYLVISGSAAPAQRAFIMLALIFLAVILGRRALSIRTISMAAFIVALISPEYVINPGFQMSFAASLALIAFYQHFGRLFSANNTPNRNHGFIRHGIGRFSAFVVGIASTSLIAGFATAPFASWHFHKIAVYSLMGNLLAMPIFTILVIPFLFVGVCLIPLGLDAPFFQVSAFGLNLIQQTSGYTAQLPGAIWGVGAASLLTLLFESLILIFLCLNFKKLWPWAGLLFLISMFVRLGSPKPIIWIGEGGGAIISRSSQTTTLEIFGKPNDFALRQFSETAGLPNIKMEQITVSKQANCDQNGCTINILDKQVSLRFSNDDIETDCRLSDLIISARRLSPRQEPACKNVKFLTYYGDKNTVIYQDKGRWKLIKPKSDRLWDRAQKRRRPSY